MYIDPDDYKGTLFEKRLLNKGFNENDIKDFIDVVNNTCMYCYNRDDSCQCWNDA